MAKGARGGKGHQSDGIGNFAIGRAPWMGGVHELWDEGTGRDGVQPLRAQGHCVCGIKCISTFIHHTYIIYLWYIIVLHVHTCMSNVYQDSCFRTTVDHLK